MHDTAPNTTSSWPAAPVTQGDLLTLLVKGLQEAGMRAQMIQTPRLQLEEFQPSTRAAIAAALTRQPKAREEAA